MDDVVMLWHRAGRHLAAQRQLLVRRTPEDEGRVGVGVSRAVKRVVVGWGSAG